MSGLASKMVEQLQRDLGLSQERAANYAQENERLRKALSARMQELDTIKRTREQERDYADVCYENGKLRALLRQWQFDVGGASERLERETLAAINAVPQTAEPPK